VFFTIGGRGYNLLWKVCPAGGEHFMKRELI